MTLVGIKCGELILLDAEGHPASPSLVQNGDKRTQILCGGLGLKLKPLGIFLLQRAGIQRGDAFILVLDNDRTSVACLLAAMSLHCICALVGKSRSHLVDYIKLESGICKVLTVDDTNESVSVQTDAIQVEPGEEAASILWFKEKNICKVGGVCLLTSGTEGGKPKIVLCAWNRMLLQGLSTNQQLFPTRPARIICGASITHAYAINTIFALYTSPYDAQSELCFASSAVGLYTLLMQRSEMFTALYATPGIYTALAAMPPTQLYADVPYCAGTRLCVPLFQKIRDNYGLLLMQNYGSTETGGIAAWSLYGKAFSDEVKEMERNNKLLYAGSTWPGVEMQILNYGELVVKTPWQSVGYIKEGQLFQKYQICCTSDCGQVTQDKDGVNCIWLERRVRDSVEFYWHDQRKACKPETIEEVMISHPNVTDALILTQNVNDRKQGIIRARVVLNTDIAAAASTIKRWCVRNNLPAMRESLHIELVNYLPCSSAGKPAYT